MKIFKSNVMNKNQRFRIKYLYVCLYFFLSAAIYVVNGNPVFNVTLNNGQKNSQITAKDADGFQFVSIQDLADCLDARTYYSEKAKKVILYLGDQEIRITALNPFILINEKIFQLPLETRFLNADIFVPLKFFIELLQNIPAIQIRFDEFRRQIDIKIDTTPGAITSLIIEPKSNGTLIKIPTPQPLAINDITTRTSHDWIYLDIYKGIIDSVRIAQTMPVGIVREIIPMQPSENMAQISFRISKDVLDVKASLSKDGSYIYLIIRTQDHLSESVLKSLENDRQKWQIDKIAIDPGHGGKDPGAIGPGGVYEKTVVLKIAQYLKDLLTSQTDVEVVMTRDSDKFIPLNERAALANRVGAKLFISIHANSNRSSRVTGSSTYILGPAKTEEAIEVARIENSVIRLENTPTSYPDFNNEQFILSSIAQSEFTRESEEFAAILQQKVSDKTGIKNRGVKQAGYYVLIGASMPNILFEVAFISNRQEEKLLKTTKFQKEVAEALFESIKNFKEKYEQAGALFGQF